MKTNHLKPTLWLIICIVGLPQIAETIYTPSLPDIARSLNVSANQTEYTLTIYLFGFAVGVLLWGGLSDRIGRKPALMLGLAIYMLGCIACFFAPTIEVLMLARFVQAFGGSTGSVLGQAIARDAFPQSERGKAFSMISLAMGFAPGVGPVIGGFTDHNFGWRAVFLVLIGLGTYVFFKVLTQLPETKQPGTQRAPLLKSAWNVLTDRRILTYGFLVGGCNGILFSFYGEGPFYFIKILGVSVNHYGLLCLGTAIPLILGSLISRQMHAHGKSGDKIILAGCGFCSTGAISLLALVFAGFINPQYGAWAISAALFLVMLTFVGIPMIISNCLSSALEHYSHMAGTAASLFGFYYYLWISAMTGIMGSMHNGTLIPMPLFFTGICFSMIGAFAYYIKREVLVAKTA
tara:strand:+ start:2514 stop:3728 length:1215 start_codon:yes stop_codon:yes gene_type:complete